VGSIPASRTKTRKPTTQVVGFFFGPTNMSQVISTESDDEEWGLPALPAGTRNYMTPKGYARLRAELFSLIDDERPKVVEIVHWAASNGDRSENGDYLYAKSACARLIAVFVF
jgi:hypothetical protein